jgi:hypothetical protein
MRTGIDGEQLMATLFYPAAPNQGDFRRRGISGGAKGS